jgi:hypothetical protein
MKANMPSYKKGTTQKLTNVQLQEIMSDLMTNRKTSLLTIYALSVYYKISITLVKDRMYHEYVLSEEVHAEEMFIHFRHGKYGIYLEESPLVVNKSEMFRFEHIHKPLRGISTYKIADLENLFVKYVRNGLEDETAFKKWKKGELYDLLLQKIVW